MLYISFAYQKGTEMEKENDRTYRVLTRICNAKMKGTYRGGEALFRCPYREEKTVGINLDKGIWHCFRECGICTANKGNLVHLYMLFKGVSDYGRARTRLDERMKRIYGDHAPAPVRSREDRKASDDVKDGVYTALLKTLDLSDEHRRSLKKRGLTDGYIDRMMFRSLPEASLLPYAIEKVKQETGMNSSGLAGVPGFFLGDNGQWALNFRGSGILIPYVDFEGRITGLQTRYDDPPGGVIKGNRYRWLTSKGRKGGTRASVVFSSGLFPGRSWQPEDVSLKEICVTEGALKAAVASCISGKRFCSIPGVSCYTAFEKLLNELESMGIKRITDAFDLDRQTNVSVENAIRKLEKMCISRGMAFVGYGGEAWMPWTAEYKGVDDYLLEMSVKKRDILKHEKRIPALKPQLPVSMR